MVSGPGSSQARFERGRSRPTSSITMATSGRLLRSRNGTALRRHVCGARRGRSQLLRPRRSASPRASAVAGPVRPRCIWAGRADLRCGRIAARSRSRADGRSALHLLERLARQAFAVDRVRGAPPASNRRPGWRKTAGYAPSTIAYQRQATSPARSPSKRCAQARATTSRGLRTPSVRLPASVLPRRHLNNPALTPWPCRHYCALVQSRRQNKRYKVSRQLYRRACRLRPTVRRSRLKPRRLASSSILWFSRSTWPTTRLMPRALA